MRVGERKRERERERGEELLWKYYPRGFSVRCPVALSSQSWSAVLDESQQPRRRFRRRSTLHPLCSRCSLPLSTVVVGDVSLSVASCLRVIEELIKIIASHSITYPPFSLRALPLFSFNAFPLARESVHLHFHPSFWPLVQVRTELMRRLLRAASRRSSIVRKKRKEKKNGKENEKKKSFSSLEKTR